MEMNPKLLIPGWAGELTPSQYKFVYTSLKNNGKLRNKWGLTEEQLTKENIKMIADEGNGREYYANGKVVPKHLSYSR